MFIKIDVILKEINKILIKNNKIFIKINKTLIINKLINKQEQV